MTQKLVLRDRRESITAVAELLVNRCDHCKPCEPFCFFVQNFYDSCGGDSESHATRRLKAHFNPRPTTAGSGFRAREMFAAFPEVRWLNAMHCVRAINTYIGYIRICHCYMMMHWAPLHSSVEEGGGVDRRISTV